MQEAYADTNGKTRAAHTTALNQEEDSAFTHGMSALNQKEDSAFTHAIIEIYVF